MPLGISNQCDSQVFFFRSKMSVDRLYCQKIKDFYIFENILKCKIFKNIK